ncbi:MAG: glycosyltransferase, partial [Bdellovibrionales bacterium]|nr:glycosyltransferase [Bdellovibrionales bacterium]
MSSVKWTQNFHNHHYNSILLCTKNSPAAKQASLQGLQTIEINQPKDYLSFQTRRDLKKIIELYQPKAFFNHLTRDLWHLSPILKKYPNIQLFNFARMFIRGVKKHDWFHRYIYSRLDTMIALSHIQKSLLLEALPIPDIKYAVIPNAVDTEKFQPRPANKNIRQDLGVTNDNQLLV